MDKMCGLDGRVQIVSGDVSRQTYSRPLFLYKVLIAVVKLEEEQPANGPQIGRRKV